MLKTAVRFLCVFYLLVFTSLVQGKETNHEAMRDKLLTAYQHTEAAIDLFYDIDYMLEEYFLDQLESEAVAPHVKEKLNQITSLLERTKKIHTSLLTETADSASPEASQQLHAKAQDHQVLVDKVATMRDFHVDYT